MYTKSEVLEFIEEEDVKFIRLAFFDLKGKQKNISIMPSELNRAFENGIPFDASAIEGFEGPQKSELYLKPDSSTLAIIPWRPATGKVVRMFCNILTPDGKLYLKDSRTILQNACQHLTQHRVADDTVNHLVDTFHLIFGMYVQVDLTIQRMHRRGLCHQFYQVVVAFQFIAALGEVFSQSTDECFLTIGKRIVLTTE